MNRKIFCFVSVFVLSAMLALSSGYVQAQLTGDIPVVVDEFGNEEVAVIFQDPSGKIGIGTTSPNAKLQVNGTGAFGDNVGIGTSPNPNEGFMLHLSKFLNGRTVAALIENTGPFSAAALLLKTQASGNSWNIRSGDRGDGTADGFIITEEGISSLPFIIKPFTNNVGIGTQPGAKLHVSGGDVAITPQGYGLILKAENGPNCFRLRVGNLGGLSTYQVPCP